MSIRGTVRLGVAELERRDNPSSFWEDTYVGAFLSGLGEGAENIATGAADGVTEVINTGSDLYTIYTSGDDLDPSDLESSLFQGAAATAGDQDAADAFDNHLVYGIATLGVGPLVESGYDAAVTGDSTQFSQQSGAFGVMVLVPYAGVRGLNALPPVRVPYPALRPGMALMTADGAIIPTGGTVAVEWATVGTVAVPAEASTAIAGAGGVVVMAMSADGNGGGGVDGFSSFEETVEQAVQQEWANRGDWTADAMTLEDLSSPHEVANLDPNLGPNQVRYQATFVNEVTGETIDVSINYDPTTGQFGIIKPASGR